MSPPQERPSRPHLEISLPSLPQTLIPLLQRCLDPETAISELAELAARDLAVSGKVLRLANSAFIGARTPLSSVHQAVIYLGRDSLYGLTLSIGIGEFFNKKIATLPGFDKSSFWHHALLTALLAKDLAVQSDVPQPTDYYLAGLLHDAGKIILAENFPEQFTEPPPEDAPSRLDWELRRCGLDHPTAGALLAKHWQLPETMCQAVAHHHALPAGSCGDTTMATIVFLANRLANSQQHLAPADCPQAAALGLSEEQLQTCLQRQCEEMRAVASALGIEIAASPGTQPLHPEAKPPLAKPLAPLGLLLGALDNLSRAEDRERVLRVMEESLAAIFAIDRAVLLLPGQEQSRCQILGSTRNRLLHRLTRDKAVATALARRLASWSVSPTPLNWRRSHRDSQDEQRVFESFGGDTLEALPFAGSLSGRAMLLYHRGEPARLADAERAQSLALLLSHVGHRLQLEELHHRHAEILAGERIAVLEEAARSLGHEISNPLAVVRNYLLIIEDRPDLPAGLAQDLRSIGREVARIETISRQLNHLGKSSAQNNREPLSAETLIGETIEVLASMAIKKGVALHCQVADELPMICGDRQSLVQILHNLIVNAIEATTEGAQVRVRCYRREEDDSGETVSIEVADNGPGLSPIARERLFRAGYSTKGEGHAGLGLAIVKKLTGDLGGTIGYRPTPGGGATFCLQFTVKTGSSDCDPVP